MTSLQMQAFLSTWLHKPQATAALLVNLQLSQPLIEISKRESSVQSDCAAHCTENESRQPAKVCQNVPKTGRKTHRELLK